MAWTSMHFAVGMCGGAAVLAVPCLILRRGWRHVPLAMTLGGIWAILPDAPRLWRVDFPGLPFADTLGAMDLELWLHSIGNLFFMHRSLDAQPKEFALLGLATIIGLYNLCLIGMCWHARRLRNKTSPRPAGLPHTPAPNDTGTPLSTVNQAPPTRNTPDAPNIPATPNAAASRHTGNPVVGRIGSR